MKRFLNVSIATMVGFLTSAVAAQAQQFAYPQVRPTNTYVRPPVLSPYLNLTPVRPAGVNFFLNVVPELDRRAQFNQINTQLWDLQRQRVPAQQPLEDPLLPPLQVTGHPAGFMNFAPYFTFPTNAAGASTQQYFRPPPSSGSRGGR
jgi:hypothetical protein